MSLGTQKARSSQQTTDSRHICWLLPEGRKQEPNAGARRSGLLILLQRLPSSALLQAHLSPPPSQRQQPSAISTCTPGCSHHIPSASGCHKALRPCSQCPRLTERELHSQSLEFSPAGAVKDTGLSLAKFSSLDCLPASPFVPSERSLYSPCRFFVG